MVDKYFLLSVTNKTKDIKINTQVINVILFACDKDTFWDENMMVCVIAESNGSLVFNA